MTLGYMREKSCRTCKWWFPGRMYDPPHCDNKEECYEDTPEFWEGPDPEYNTSYQGKEAKAKRLTKERDAAIEDLQNVLECAYDACTRKCGYCKHGGYYESGEETQCGRRTVTDNAWEWRGFRRLPP